MFGELLKLDGRSKHSAYLMTDKNKVILTGSESIFWTLLCWNEMFSLKQTSCVVYFGHRFMGMILFELWSVGDSLLSIIIIRDVKQGLWIMRKQKRVVAEGLAATVR